MEQPGFAMLRMEKVLEAQNEYDQFQIKKEEGRRALQRHGSEGL